MSFTLILMPGEPVVVLRGRLGDIVDSEQLPRLKAHIRRLIPRDIPSLYVIWDLTGQEVPMYAIQLLIQDAEAGPIASVADPRIAMLIVGDDPGIRILQRKVRSRFGLIIRNLPTVDDALDWARQEAARHAD